MPRPASEPSDLVADLHARLDRLLEVARAEGRDEALANIRALVGGGAAPARRGPGRPRGSKNKPKADGAPAKPSGRRKNPWAGLSAEERLARVNAIRKGRGLPPKTA
jgi:hypothetical protein